MTSNVQAVIQDRGQILIVPADQLRSDLKSAPTDELKLFLKTIASEEWQKTLSSEQKTSLCVKVFTVLPPAASFDLIEPFMKTLQKFNVPRPSEESVKKIFCENREFYLAGIREVYCKEHNVEEVSDQTLFLYLIFSKLSHEELVPFDELMQEEVSLTEKVNGKDLLEIGYTHGNADQFKRILAYYQSKMENSAFRELIVERGEKIAGKIADRLELLGVFLETCKSLKIKQIDFSLILSSAKRKQQEALNLCLQRMKESGIDLRNRQWRVELAESYTICLTIEKGHTTIDTESVMMKKGGNDEERR